VERPLREYYSHFCGFKDSDDSGKYTRADFRKQLRYVRVLKHMFTLKDVL